jgi:dipeptidyl aminopeptidase/acylaminoacyl peptidase
MFRRFLVCAAFLAGAVAVSADDPSVEQLEKQLAELQAKLAELKKKPAEVVKKTLTIADADAWRSFRGASPFEAGYKLSNDGKWLGYRAGPTTGEGEIVVRNLVDGKETKYASGSASGTLAFSFDSKWVTFSTTPAIPRGLPPSMAAALPRPRPKIVLLNLEKNEKTELEGFASLQFNGETSTHVALRKATEAPSGTPTSLPPGIAPPAPAAPTSTGSDLVLRELATGSELLLGNVSEFSFNKAGDKLVLLIDAASQIGNGVHLRDMKPGTTAVLDSAKASYRSLAWHEDFTAFTVVKAVDDKDYDGKWNTILAFTGIGANPTKTVYDPKDDKAFPKDMGISSNRQVSWTKNLEAITFGIAEQKKKDSAKKETAPAPTTQPAPAPTGGIGRRRDGGGGPPTSTGTPSSSGQADLVIWHWKDERLQPMQQVQATGDKSFTYLSVYHVKEKKFIRLADDTCRSVSLPGQQKFAVGQDAKPYEYMANLDGRRYSDLYVIDPKTGGRQKALTKVRFGFGTSPDGAKFLYHDDGHFLVYDFASGKSTNITANVSGTTFVDDEDDHNIAKPPTRSMGWSKDGKYILLSDNWDIWKIATDGSGGVNLTVNGKKDGLRYQQFSQFEPDRKEPGHDFSKPAFTTLYGEWTKKEGIGHIEPGKPGVTVLHVGDCDIGSLAKARDAERYAFTKQTALESPDLHVTDGTFKTVAKATDLNPQQKNYHWMSGTKLIEYTALGKKLQGALYLPANYKPGTKYPTVVYIYEKLSDGLHGYTPPGTGGFNKSIYTSNGYAVLTPDITYKINDPGKSSVECITAALDAAIATGIVDGAKLGLQGHSWGGYQTAYAITQTNRFKAACAGAPLTDLVSMYSSVYWNSGSANQPIFESSQGRFTAGYWDQQEAYIRNSPVYFAKNVTTPLLLLHNDKDGAVDFTQGIEYYNTLRRLQKPVVMLQYKGENHGLAKPENRKDYAKRMQEFFDHHLQGKAAPDWWKDGVPHLKMDEHLKGRR